MWRFIQRHPFRVALFIAFIIGVIAIRLFDIAAWIDIATLLQYRDALIAYVTQRYWESVLVFVSVYAIENMFALPFSFALSIAAGFLYGLPAAVAYIVIGATCGAVLAFIVTRYLIGYRLQAYYKNAFERFNRELENNGIYYLFVLRLIPIVPFFLINILAGLTRISVLIFTITTAIGILPGAFVYASAGYHLRTVDTLGDIFTWDMLLILCLLILFAVMPVVIKKWYGWRPLEPHE